MIDNKQISSHHPFPKLCTRHSNHSNFLKQTNMKKLILYAMLIFPCSLMAQIGIKAGLNFANVTNASDINSSSETGFHGGIFLAPPSKSFLSSRTEFLFSRQGYDYSTNTNTGNVNLDYIMLPQYMAFNITKYCPAAGWFPNGIPDQCKSRFNQ